MFEILDIPVLYINSNPLHFLITKVMFYFDISLLFQFVRFRNVPFDYHKKFSLMFISIQFLSFQLLNCVNWLTHSSNLCIKRNFYVGGFFEYQYIQIIKEKIEEILEISFRKLGMFNIS